ncbi:hypothetical protein BDQ12DRAFT_372657 [Crucibulum laeve]|uniref:Uncharacterized protein n=1 Tax=Crucibulum laeve TaxID=68775 RepID=A0A5C3LNK5_9AGAR|nr:hypothetical protein BDQ12DRAFT_372657 [Crucibulum laeve]
MYCTLNQTKYSPLVKGTPRGGGTSNRIYMYCDCFVWMPRCQDDDRIIRRMLVGCWDAAILCVAAASKSMFVVEILGLLWARLRLRLRATVSRNMCDQHGGMTTTSSPTRRHDLVSTTIHLYLRNFFSFLRDRSCICVEETPSPSQASELES